MSQSNDTYTTEEYRYYALHGKFPERASPVTTSTIAEGLFIDPLYSKLLTMVKDNLAIFIPGNVVCAAKRSCYFGKSIGPKCLKLKF